MYQVPIDMMTRIASVALETKSPCSNIAWMPYGFSTVSFATTGAGGATGAGFGASTAGFGASAAGAWANVAVG